MSGSVAIVYGGAAYKGAARELAAYVERIGGVRPRLVAGRRLPAEARRVFVVGPPEANALAQELDDALDGAISKALARPQAIVVWPAALDGKRCVVLAGAGPVATLHAVYAYLEEFCHAGFFQDGEHVPKRTLVFEGRPFVSAPRFLDRKAPSVVGTGHWALKKFYARFWSLDEIKHAMRWAAKRRMNMAFIEMGVTGGLTDIVARRACEAAGYPIGPPTEQMLDVSGFPTSWTWPPELRLRMTREALAYGRALGIRFAYGVAPGQVPLEFKAKYPQFRYIESERWSHAEVHPDDPFHDVFARQYLREIIAAYGTDHLYCANPYCETSSGGGADDDFELKKKAGLRFVELLAEADPDAVWLGDSWDFFWTRETWTAARVKAYLNAIPDERFYIYDTNADQRGIPVHLEHDYFHGKTWAFGVMHSAATHDQIHGDLGLMLARLQQAATDTKARRCRGVFLVPELTNYNVMYYDFLTRAAWDPTGVRVEEFLDDYALRRYGARSAPAMRRALGEVVAALFTRELNVPVYNLAILKWIWRNAAPWIHEHTIPRLVRAVTTALDERPRQRTNALYENDLLSVTKALLAEVAGYCFHQANAAYACSDEQRLERAAGDCLRAIEWIARILSTRADCSLREMIREVMRVPGTNPNTPRMILQGCINWDYCSNDSYEQVANYDLPRMRDYFRLVGKRFGDGRPPIDLWKEVDGLSPTHDDWINGKATLKRTVTYDGATLNAIAEAVKWCASAVPARLVKGQALRPRRVAWREDFSSPAHWEPGEPGTRLKGNVISSDPAFGPTGTRMHKEWVDMPVWGTVRTSPRAGLAAVDLHPSRLLTIRTRIEKGLDPVHLWANWRGKSGQQYRTRVWRSFAPRGKWKTDTIDLLDALRSQTDEPAGLLSLEFCTFCPPHEVRIERLELSG